VVEAAGMVGSLRAAGDQAGYGRRDGHAEIVALTSGSNSASPLFSSSGRLRWATNVDQVCRVMPLLL
jgi:hypothetical protein